MPSLYSWGGEVTPTDFFAYMDVPLYGYYRHRGIIDYHKPQHKRKVDCIAFFTVLRSCEDCGKISTPKKIRDWYLSTGEYVGKWPEYKYKTLCWPCYNKKKPLESRFNETLETKRILGRLQRDIASTAKAQRAKETQ